MKILIFTEGTILMHLSAKNLSREEIVEESQSVGIERAAREVALKMKLPMPTEVDPIFKTLIAYSS